MRSLLTEFTRDIGQSRTVVVMDEDGLAPPRQYQFAPSFLLWRVAATVVALMLLTFLLVAFTPIRNIIPGYSTAEMRMNAENNAIRLAQLQDSLALQSEYMSHLRGLVTGALSDTTLPPLAAMPPAYSTQPAADPEDAPADPAAGTAQARPLPMRTVAQTMTDIGWLSGGLSLPALPPVDGFVTRPYRADDEHFAVDIAVSEGTSVRSIGDGYVILADWTQLGGYAIAVQHAGGYVSVYKHNSQLLKNVGDRVRGQEPIARSGNTGEVTTGPHLHFELWLDGIAQNPRQYILGW